MGLPSLQWLQRARSIEEEGLHVSIGTHKKAFVKRMSSLEFPEFFYPIPHNWPRIKQEKQDGTVPVSEARASDGNGGVRLAAKLGKLQVALPLNNSGEWYMIFHNVKHL